MVAETKVPVIFQTPSQVPSSFNKGVKAWHRRLSHTPLSHHTTKIYSLDSLDNYDCKQAQISSSHPC